MRKARNEYNMNVDQAKTSERLWWISRFYCLGLLILAAMVVSNPIVFMIDNPLESWRLPITHATGYAYCNELGSALGYTMALFIGAPFIFLDRFAVRLPPLIKHQCTIWARCLTKSCEAIIEAIFGLVIVFCFTQVAVWIARNLQLSLVSEGGWCSMVEVLNRSECW
jgi:hypothetical protein